MPTAEPRYCIAQVTEEARNAWRDFCDANDIDRTTLCEVIGLHLARGSLPAVEVLVAEARSLKNERRRRG